MLSAMKGYKYKKMKYDSVCKKWTMSGKGGLIEIIFEADLILWKH